MKCHETSFEEYINAINSHNLHNEMTEIYEMFPPNIINIGNIIIFGSSGIGKYSQSLKIIQKYSPSMLKYDKKIKIQNDKQQYTIRMSDIHFEIDMSLLGCNAKNIWHDIFMQIIDIISIKPEKKCIILCKNFHNIHPELLEIFYSYMQQYNHFSSNIQIRFIINTEHVSFLPNNILDCCKIISIKRPTPESYLDIINNNNNKQPNFIENMTHPSSCSSINNNNNLVLHPINYTMLKTNKIENIKEIKYWHLIKNEADIPKNVFNVVCDKLIFEMERYNNIEHAHFRDVIYDILTYNLDIYECIWYILNYFIKNQKLSYKDTIDILNKIYTFLKYYNNNYRPIYHLENILFYIILKIHNIPI
jgi:hypothetical protein